MARWFPFPHGPCRFVWVPVCTIIQFWLTHSLSRLLYKALGLPDTRAALILTKTAGFATWQKELQLCLGSMPDMSVLTVSDLRLKHNGVPPTPRCALILDAGTRNGQTHSAWFFRLWNTNRVLSTKEGGGWTNVVGIRECVVAVVMSHEGFRRLNPSEKCAEVCRLFCLP